VILEKVKITNNAKAFVTRICDNCSKKEKVRMSVVFRGRLRRGKNIDLCRKCSCSRKYKPVGSWPVGEDSHLWRGGLRKDSRGFCKYAGTEGKYVYEHRYVVSQALQRELLPEEVVHHIDMNKYNNDIQNLYLFINNSAHIRCHVLAENLVYSLLGEYVWFDRKKQEYTTEPVSAVVEDVVDLRFLEGKRIRIYRRRLVDGQFKCYQYYNIKKKSKGYHKRYVHTEIMKRFIKRDLFRGECVHHINGDTLDNSFDNLILLKNSRHAWVHKFSLSNMIAQLYNRGIVVFNDGTYRIKI